MVDDLNGGGDGVCGAEGGGHSQGGGAQQRGAGDHPGVDHGGGGGPDTTGNGSNGRSGGGSKPLVPDMFLLVNICVVWMVELFLLYQLLNQLWHLLQLFLLL